MAMMVIVNVYDDGDVDDGDAFLVSWHRCIDLISLYMHAPSGLTREARLDCRVGASRSRCSP